MEFQTAYNEVDACLANYIRLKKEGGWVEKARTFQIITMYIILEKKDIEYLKIRVQELADSLCSKTNWFSFGMIGGSSLKADLEKIIKQIPRPPALQIPSEGIPTTGESSYSPISQEGRPLCASLESPPSTPSTTRAPSLPTSPMSVTGCFAKDPDPFTSAFRNLEVEQLKSKNFQGAVVPTLSKEEQNAIFSMKYH